MAALTTPVLGKQEMKLEWLASPYPGFVLPLEVQVSPGPVEDRHETVAHDVQPTFTAVPYGLLEGGDVSIGLKLISLQLSTDKTV